MAQRTPLEDLMFDAAARGDAEALRRHLDDGADARATFGPLTRTALVEAAAEGHLECVKLLARLPGADIPDRSGCCALSYAFEEGSRDMRAVLMASPLISGSEATRLAHLGFVLRSLPTDAWTRHLADFFDGRPDELAAALGDGDKIERFGLHWIGEMIRWRDNHEKGAPSDGQDSNDPINPVAFMKRAGLWDAPQSAQALGRHWRDAVATLAAGALARVVAGEIDQASGEVRSPKPAKPRI